MKLDYLKTIAGADLNHFFSKQVVDAFLPENSTPARTEPTKDPQRPVFTTVNPQYAKRLQQLAGDLEKYMKDGTLVRPFLYLILGPPGAGKSFLIARLIDYLGAKGPKNTRPIIFQQANLSELIEPNELHQLYINIKNNTANELSTITLLDEFDIKWSGGSAIKYLINPIYDGKFWNGYEFQKLGKCAFFFAGSYLQDRETLLKTQKLLAGVNLNEFLFDLYFEMRKKDDFQGMKEIREIQNLCYMHQKWRAEVDPQTDTIFYLSNLEKIKDFLSRIAGNVFEILDVSWPLHLTVDEFVIENRQEVTPSAGVKLGEVMAYVMHRLEKEGNKGKGKMRMIKYGANQSPLLEYKNMILCERLLRVIDFLKSRFRDRFKKDDIVKNRRGAGVLMDRRLLNFLTVVPLINGMRSLEQLVNKLEVPEEGQAPARIEPKEFKFAEISMIIYEAEKFGDPVEVWAQLVRCNPKRAREMLGSNDDIFIPLAV
jgi:hypothetical protein